MAQLQLIALHLVILRLVSFIVRSSAKQAGSSINRTSNHNSTCRDNLSQIPALHPKPTTFQLRPNLHLHPRPLLPDPIEQPWPTRLASCTSNPPPKPRKTHLINHHRSLYRRALKLTLDWSVHRHLWRGQAMYIRSLFEAQKNVREPRQQKVSIPSPAFHGHRKWS